MQTKDAKKIYEISNLAIYFLQATSRCLSPQSGGSAYCRQCINRYYNLNEAIKKNLIIKANHEKEFDNL
jgi:hypothetical protein